MNQFLLENQICFPVYVAYRTIVKAYQPFLQEFEITYPQYLVLITLWEKGNLTVNQIAQLLDLKTNTITPLLKRMEKNGLIKRVRSFDDERKVSVSIAPKAQKLKKQLECLPEKLIENSGFGIERLINLKNELNQLIENLKTHQNE